MTIREELISILRVPIYPHEQVDPAEVVADYLLDNDVVPVTRCKECKFWTNELPGCTDHVKFCKIGYYMAHENGFCSFGERRGDHAAD